MSAMDRIPSHHLRAFAAPLLLSALAASAASGCHPASGVVKPEPSTLATPTPVASAELAAALAPVFAQAEHEAGGRLGVAVLHIESGERASYHGTERFPMQSVFK